MALSFSVIDTTMTSTARDDDAFVLDAPDLAEIKVDGTFVWAVYHEFLSVSPGREELAFGVIGFD